MVDLVISVLEPLTTCLRRVINFWVSNEVTSFGFAFFIVRKVAQLFDYLD